MVWCWRCSVSGCGEAAQVDVSTFASIVTLSNPGFNITSEILETGIRIQCVPKKNRL